MEEERRRLRRRGEGGGEEEKVEEEKVEGTEKGEKQSDTSLPFQLRF